MGCICSKGLLPNHYVINNHHRRDKEPLNNKVSKQPPVGVDAAAVAANDATIRLITEEEEEDPVSSDDGEKKTKAMPAPSSLHNNTISTNGHVVAGWPSWLTAVAEEAISGWVPRKADSFERLDKVEQLHKIFKLCGSPSEEYWKRSKLPHATIFKPTQPYKRCVAETFTDFPVSNGLVGGPSSSRT